MSIRIGSVERSPVNQLVFRKRRECGNLCSLSFGLLRPCVRPYSLLYPHILMPFFLFDLLWTLAHSLLYPHIPMPFFLIAFPVTRAPLLPLSHPPPPISRHSPQNPSILRCPFHRLLSDGGIPHPSILRPTDNCVFLAFRPHPPSRVSRLSLACVCSAFT